MRRLDQQSTDALRAREGCRLKAYQDEGGVWTIGYGHTGDVHEGDVIDQHQADVLFDHDTAPMCECVDASVKVELTDNQFGALVSFCYNVGIAAFVSSTLLRKLNAGDYASVPAEMRRWVKVNGKRSEGLVNRRDSEVGQWTRGAFVSSSNITPDQPPPFWRNPVIVKGASAIASAATAAASNISSDNVRSAAEAARNAAQTWHVFSIAAAVLAGMLVLWLLFDHRKST